MLSVVAPVCNEEDGLPAFYERIRTALSGLDFELILVDDGSSDASPLQLEQIAADDPRVKVITLSRNFGHQAALTAGLDHATGNPVVMIDADLQDPPELILTLMDHWRSGSDVVYTVRSARAGESAFKLRTARGFYRLFSRLSQVKLEQNAGDFRLLDRAVLDSLLSMRERHRFLRGMTAWVGFTQTAVPYERDARYGGKTKFTLRRMLGFSVDAISSFSYLPLQAATALGLLFAATAFAAIPVIIVLRLLHHYLPGFATSTIIVLLLGGIQLICLGVVGEYLGRIYDEVKQRPLYLVRGTRNVPAEDQPGERSRSRVPTGS
jgi:polyisoprenyl-phosphate glycosyltransferase